MDLVGDKLFNRYLKFLPFWTLVQFSQYHLKLPLKEVSQFQWSDLWRGSCMEGDLLQEDR